MSTFHPFPLLPFELRAQIWEMTVEPRTVDVRVVHMDWDETRHLRSSTPVPATLHSCREARNQKLYRKVFSELENHHDVEKRYVWLNLDIDLVSIGRSWCSDYEKVAATLKRLKFERVSDNDHFFWIESRNLYKLLPSLEEMHVVCADGFMGWGGALALGHHRWPCHADNLYFIDAHDGSVARGWDLERVCAEKRDELLAAEESGGSATSTLSGEDN
jgi:hypothetical protein